MEVKTYQYIIFLIFIGLTSYLKSLFSGFALDDIGQIVRFKLVHSPANIPQLFQGVLAFSNTHPGITHYYYKPLLFISFALVYAIGHGNPFTFHLFLLLLHITNTLLLFIFFLKLWSKKLAFFLSLLFLIQPVSSDVAVYISNLQDTLFFFFGMLSLLVASNRFYKYVSPLAFGFFLLCSLLSKETGILFVIIIPIFLYLFQKQYLKQYLFAIAITLVIYILLRLNASTHPYIYLLNYPIQHTGLLSRLNISFFLSGFFIQELLLPMIKFPNYLKSGFVPFINSFAYLLEFTLFIIIVIFLSYWIKRRNKKQFLLFIFFSIWVFLGILFHSQLLFSLDVSIALRWLYFPLVGMLGLFGASITACYSKPFIYRRLLPYAYVFVLILYVGETLYLLFAN